MAGARDFSQLVAWQLADALRIEVVKLTQAAPCATDWKFRGQVEDAIDSVCRNIAEGFGADTHAQFAWFLRVSRRSLNEVRDALRSALLKRYRTPAELSPAFDLTRRLFPALNNFSAYLERTPHIRQGRSRPDLPKRERNDQPKQDHSDPKRPRPRRPKRPPKNEQQQERSNPSKDPRTDKRSRR